MLKQVTVHLTSSASTFPRCLTLKIDFIVSDFPTAKIVVLDDFNAHNRVVWFHRNRTSRLSNVIIRHQQLSGLVTEPTYFIFRSTSPATPWALSDLRYCSSWTFHLVFNTLSHPIELELSVILPLRSIWCFNKVSELSWSALIFFPLCHGTPSVSRLLILQRYVLKLLIYNWIIYTTHP